MNAIVQVNGQEFRQSTDAAGLCGEIVKKTAKNIQGRRFVACEGWQAIAIAHGCAASADHVERVEDEGMSGFKAIGIVRRMSDGAEITRAEGFLGDDETTWAKRPVYARRAMVQTRAISRACRSAFAHVVVMIDAGLSTTPAEEVPDGGFNDSHYVEQPAPEQAKPAKKTVNWGGRYPTKTALKQAMHTHHAELERLGIEGSHDDLEDLLTSPEYKDYIAQASEHAPAYLEGPLPESAPPEFIQTFTLEQKARDMIALRGGRSVEREAA